MNWLDSIHSEVNKQFVSNPYPKLGDVVRIRIRFLDNNEVKKVFLRAIISGGSTIFPMHKEFEKKRFIYYSCNLPIKQKWINYHFIIETSDNFYFYNRKEITTYHPTEDYDFVIIADFENPEWVPRSVFYQIYPDRFCNGNPNNDVQTNEYKFDGHYTIKMNWNDKPLEYHDGHCLDFFNGDLEGIQQKIDYFKELGVNALYLNPIFEGRTTHRYDCTDYFKVDPHLGGDSALISLVKELHKNDIKIILDVSINHTGIEHKWFKKAISNRYCKERKFYYIDDNNNHIGWAGVNTLPQLNYSSKKLRDIIFRDDDSLVRYYIKEPFNIDGWRFDVGNVTARINNDQFGNEIFQEIRKAVKSIKKDAYIIAEHWEDSISYLLGDQWDSAMNYFASSRPLRSFAGETDHFLISISNSLKAKKPLSGIDVKNQILQHYLRLPNQIAFLQFNLLDSHDIHRFHNYQEIFNWNIYKGMIITLFLLPGTPSIYYGDEIGLNGHIETVEGCRYPMVWDREKWNISFFELYKTLSHLKRKESALHTGSYKVLFADEDTFVLSRFDDKKTFIGILSKNETEKDIKIPVSVIGVDDNTSVKVLVGDNLPQEQYYIKDYYLSLKLPVKGNLLLEL